MADYSRVVGQTVPFFRASLTDAAGRPANLSDATLRFIMRPIRGDEPKVAADAVIENPGDPTAEPPVPNVVYYEQTADDMDTEGGFWVQWEATYTNGKLETFPSDAPMTCAIFPDLEAVTAS